MCQIIGTKKVHMGWPMLTGCLLTQQADQALSSPLHNFLLHLWVQRVSFNAQDLQVIQGAEFVWQRSDLVIEEQELSQKGAHANLWRQLGDLIVGRFKKPKMSQLADRRGQMRELVGGNIELM